MIAQHGAAGRVLRRFPYLITSPFRSDINLVAITSEAKDLSLFLLEAGSWRLLL